LQQLLLHYRNKENFMDNETKIDVFFAILIGVAGACLLLHSLDALFF
jgi:hypothetical protein